MGSSSNQPKAKGKEIKERFKRVSLTPIEGWENRAGIARGLEGRRGC